MNCTDAPGARHEGVFLWFSIDFGWLLMAVWLHALLHATTLRSAPSGRARNRAKLELESWIASWGQGRRFFDGSGPAVIGAGFDGCLNTFKRNEAIREEAS